MADVDLGPASVARVREAADIVEVVSEHVSLKRRGRRWVGLCPFHQEKTPSFSVDPERGLYYCFGCHAGGDVIRFVMELEHLAFPEAIRHLADRFGVTLPEASPEAGRRARAADRARALLAEAQAWFREQLLAPRGSAARAELERRGFPRETWEDYGFGFAPDAWRDLLEHLGKRHTQGAILEAGLALTSDRGGSPYDRFRNRITFPIHGSDGRIVAFGGRALGDTEPKYLNSPEGPLFHKRSTLFLLHRARRPMGDAGHALVVEGYFDCLSLHRAGFAQAVATLGTALTADHARILRRLVPRVLLCYDADAAGRKAAAAGARVLLAAGLEVAVVALEPGKDPDDVIREEGPEAFGALVDTPQPLIDFLCADLPPDPAERRKAGTELAPLMGSARDPVVRFALLEELARRLDLPLEMLREHARGSGPPRRAAEPAPAPAQESIPPGELCLASILLHSPAERRRVILEHVDTGFLRSSRIRTLVERLAALDEDSGSDAARAILEGSDDPALVQLLAELSLGDLPEPSENGTRAQLRRLLEQQARQRARRLQEAIREAEARGDDGEIERLQAEKMRLRREIPEI